MAKKTQQSRSVPAKKNAARTPPPAVAGTKQRTREAPAMKAAAPVSETEQPRSGTLRVVATEHESVADEPELPVRWPNLQRGARQVLGLYEQRQGELRFPGVTFESLAAQADRIDQFSESVAKAKRELAEAQAAQQAAETELADAARRAFAYAQVYAQEHAELSTELEGFVYASAEKPRRKKREVQDGQPRGKQAADGAADEAAPAGEAESED